MRFFGTFSGAAQKKGQQLSVQSNMSHLSLEDPLNTSGILQKEGERMLLKASKHLPSVRGFWKDQEFSSTNSFSRLNLFSRGKGINTYLHVWGNTEVWWFASEIAHLQAKPEVNKGAGLQLHQWLCNEETFCTLDTPLRNPLLPVHKSIQHLLTAEYHRSIYHNWTLTPVLCRTVEQHQPFFQTNPDCGVPP